MSEWVKEQESVAGKMEVWPKSMDIVALPISSFLTIFSFLMGR